MYKNSCLIQYLSIRDVTACTAKLGASARDLFIRELFTGGKF